MRVRAVLARVIAVVAALVALLVARPAWAFVPPPLDGHVVDTSGKLSTAEIAELDAKLEALRTSRGLEIVVFMVGSLRGQTIEDVAYDTFNTWGVGRKGADNGVLLVVAPQERAVRIETGKGVGGALTDLQSDDIIRQKIAPRLREERYREAILDGTSAIASALEQGKTDQRSVPVAPDVPSIWKIVVYALIGLLILVLAIVSPGFRSFLFLFLAFGRGGNPRSSGGSGGSGYQGGGGRSGGGGSSGRY